LNDFGYPYVSICVPTYEQTEYLSKLIESIVKQDYKNYEVIISDDSETEAVKNMVKSKYEPLLLDKLRYHHNEPSLGSPANWNNAIKMAKFDIVKIMHHDDYFSSKDSLSKIIHQFSINPDVSVVFCGGYTITGSEKRNHTTSELVFKKTFLHPVQLYKNNVLGSPSTLCFRNYKGFFDERLRWFVDVDFYYKIFKEKLRSVFLPEPLVTCVMGSHNLTNELEHDGQNEIREYLLILKKISGFSLGTKLYVFLLLTKAMRKHGIFSFTELNSKITVFTYFEFWLFVAVWYNKIHFITQNKKL
jgi:glycosyltransferase involved in cell wall biosynthesis